MNPQLQQIRALLEQAKNILVVVGTELDIDKVASAAAIHLALTRVGKRVALAIPETAEDLSLISGLDQVVTSLAQNQFDITLDYTAPESFADVQYGPDENGKFHIMIRPQEGAPLPDASSLRYTYSGEKTDLVISVGVSNFIELGKFQTENPNLFREKPILNIDNKNTNAKFGQVNHINPNATSISEMTALMLYDMGIGLTPEAATNLMYGLSFSSQNFQPNFFSVDFLEATAVCLRAGGKRVFESAT